MKRTDNLRTQHDKLLAEATEINNLVMKADLAPLAADIRFRISKMIGVLQYHLASEDKVLYPDMISNKDAKVKITAEKFMREMGQLGTVIADFNSKWTAAYISTSPSFKTEWKTLVDTLAGRIQRENTELYPLADAML